MTLYADIDGPIGYVDILRSAYRVRFTGVPRVPRIKRANSLISIAARMCLGRMIRFGCLAIVAGRVRQLFPTPTPTPTPTPSSPAILD